MNFCMWLPAKVNATHLTLEWLSSGNRVKLLRPKSAKNSFLLKFVDLNFLNCYFKFEFYQRFFLHLKPFALFYLHFEKALRLFPNKMWIKNSTFKIYYIFIIFKRIYYFFITLDLTIKVLPKQSDSRST